MLAKVFTWVYFFLAQFVYGYLLLFCESKKPDTGGIFWVQAGGHLLVQDAERLVRCCLRPGHGSAVHRAGNLCASTDAEIHAGATTEFSFTGFPRKRWRSIAGINAHFSLSKVMLMVGVLRALTKEALPGIRGLCLNGSRIVVWILIRVL